MDSSISSSRSTMYSIHSGQIMDQRQVGKILADLSRALQEMSQAITQSIRKMQQTISNASERLNQNAVVRYHPSVQNPYGLRLPPVRQAQGQQMQPPDPSQNRQVPIHMVNQHSSSRLSLNSSQSTIIRINYVSLPINIPSSATSINIQHTQEPTLAEIAQREATQRYIFATRASIKLLTTNVGRGQAKTLLRQIRETIQETNDVMQRNELKQLHDELVHVLNQRAGTTRIEGRDRLPN